MKKFYFILLLVLLINSNVLAQKRALRTDSLQVSYDVDITGQLTTGGYNRTATVVFQECFDFISTTNYEDNWDVSALIVGTGTNDISTNASFITLTTDGAGANEKEGTRSNYAFITRAEKNRTEWVVQLSQTTTTNFYCGWNDDAANAMVAGADKYCIVFYEVGTDTDWRIKLGDGTDEEVVDTGVAVTTSETKIEVYVETDGTIHFWLDDTEIDVTSFTNKLASDSHYLIVGQLETTDGTAVTAKIDFLENEKFK